MPYVWWRRQGTILQPSACKADALPIELRPHNHGYIVYHAHAGLYRRIGRDPFLNLVGAERLELPMSLRTAGLQPAAIPLCETPLKEIM